MDLLFLLTLIALASHSLQFPPNDDGNVQALIDRLNTLLKNAGWGLLDYVEVKNDDKTLGSSTFSGKDLFIASEEPNEFYVTEENVEKKYCMTAELLGCVYGNAVVRFIHLTTPILEQCYSELNLAKTRDRSQKYYYDNKCKSSKITKPYAVSRGTYIKACKHFNTVLEQFENSRQMFDSMLSALYYLVEPLKTISDHHVITFIQFIIDSVILIRDLKTTLYPNEGHVIIDENFNDLFYEVKNFLENRVNIGLLPLLSRFCILPNKYNNEIPSTDAKTTEGGTTSEPKLLYEYSESVVRSQIEKHVEAVINKYFLGLGFHYVDGPI